MKFATIRYKGVQLYGAVTDEGVIELSGDFPQWPSMRDVIANGGLPTLEEAA